MRLGSGGTGRAGAQAHTQRQCCSPDPCPQAAAGCRAATVFMQYGIVANYCWLLVEGIYLHNLLVVAVFSERSYFTLYLCIGWGECGWAGPLTLCPTV